MGVKLDSNDVERLLNEVEADLVQSAISAAAHGRSHYEDASQRQAVVVELRKRLRRLVAMTA